MGRPAEGSARLTVAAESRTIRAMKALVTGATGFLGGHLIGLLLRNPDTEVYALVRNPEKATRLEGADRIRFLMGDLRTVPPLPAGLSVVFHLAGLTKASKSSLYYTVNQGGTASLFKALARLDDTPRVVHVSSVAAGGPSSPGRPVRESDLPHPVSPYGTSKLRAEEEALTYKNRFPLAILRVAAVYGPGDEDFLEFFRWVARGVLPRFGRGRKSLSLCYVEDAVRAVLLAGEKRVASGEIFNIADSKPHTWDDLGETAARILGRKLVRVRIPNPAVFLACAVSEGMARVRGRATAVNLSKYRDMRPDGWVADVRKAREILGFETRFSLEEGLTKTLDWYGRRGLL
jgi:dihydroflavonol-4-reductase